MFKHTFLGHLTEVKLNYYPCDIRAPSCPSQINSYQARTTESHTESHPLHLPFSPFLTPPSSSQPFPSSSIHYLYTFFHPLFSSPSFFFLHGARLFPFLPFPSPFFRLPFPVPIHPPVSSQSLSMGINPYPFLILTRTKPSSCTLIYSLLIAYSLSYSFTFSLNRLFLSRKCPFPSSFLRYIPLY